MKKVIHSNAAEQIASSYCSNLGVPIMQKLKFHERVLTREKGVEINHLQHDCACVFAESVLEHSYGQNSQKKGLG